MQTQLAPAPTEPRRVHRAGTPCPSLDSDEYASLVWALAQSRTGRVDAAGMRRLNAFPGAYQSLSRDRWVQRYLECAERSFAGRPLAGGELGSWIKRQRYAFAAGELPAGRVALLERLEGFTWTPDADRWSATFDRVAEFARRNGRIPSRGDDAILAGWLANQRFSLRKGRLDADRVTALETLPGWRDSLSTPRAPGQWDAMLGRLAEFRAEHGFYPDHRSDDPAEAELGQWAHQQRGHHHRSDLAARRVESLAKLPGWRWSTRDATFDRRVCELRDELSAGPITRDHPLYRWVETQRRRHRDGRLSDEQSDALEALGLLAENLPDALSAA